MKPIGHWYVRKERRGLVCLVIDNRHTVERLAHLEEEERCARSRLLTNTGSESFADLFPIPTSSSSTRRRGESPERKFVVSFYPQSVENCENTEQRDLCSLAKGDTRGNQQDPGEGSSSQQDSNDKMTSEQTTSHLILDVIPHQQVDKIISPTQAVTGSMLLEAKAEETVDMLMLQLTYIKPEYFSDEDRSLRSSDERSLSLSSNTFRSFSGRMNPLAYEKPSEARHSTWEDALIKEEGSAQPPGPRKGPSTRRKAAGPKPPAIRILNEDKNNIHEPAIASQNPCVPSFESGYSSDKLPSSPAPPYGASHLTRCSTCPSSSLDDSIAKKLAERVSPLETLKTEIKESPGTAHRTRDAVELLSELLKQPLYHNHHITDGLAILQDNNPNTSTKAPALDKNKTSQEAEPYQSGQALAPSKEKESIRMKDSFGRTFIFPLHMCRVWEVKFLLFHLLPY